MEEPAIHYGPTHDTGAHTSRSGITASERAAMRATIERRGERATGRAIRQEREEHWHQRARAVAGHGVQFDWPHAQVDDRPLDNRNRAGVAGAGGAVIPNVIVLISGVFKYVDLQGVVKGDV